MTVQEGDRETVSDVDGLFERNKRRRQGRKVRCNTTMNTKLDDKIDHLQEYTEMAIDKLNKRTKILNDTVDKCVESCTETLEVIKGEERGRSLALDQLIQDSKKKSC